MSGILEYLDYTFSQIHPCNDKVWSRKRERNVTMMRFLIDCLEDFNEKRSLERKIEEIVEPCKHEVIEEVEVMSNGKTLMKCKACPWLFILGEDGPREPTAEDFGV